MQSTKINMKFVMKMFFFLFLLLLLFSTQYNSDGH